MSEPLRHFYTDEGRITHRRVHRENCAIVNKQLKKLYAERERIRLELLEKDNDET